MWPIDREPFDRDRRADSVGGMHAERIRLQAWIVANDLVPIIAERSASGRLPRPVSDA
jgi:hypothetical protein